MKITILSICLLLSATQWVTAQSASADQQVIELSKTKWRWMAEKNADSLAALFHEKSMFVHMGSLTFSRLTRQVKTK